jgi:uroporphyrinogen decarboxylase
VRKKQYAVWDRINTVPITRKRIGGSNLNSISLVMDAIRHKPGTPIARGELTLDSKFARDFLNWRKADAGADSLSGIDLRIACCQALKLDLVCIQSGETADKESNLSAKITDLNRIADEGLFAFWVVNGSFQTAMARQGMMTFLADIAGSPDDVCNELRQISDHVIVTMRQGVSAGAHGIIIADDIAYSQSTYISPDFVKHRLLPIWQTQVETARDLGVPVFFHSDGNLNAVLPYIVAAGFDGLQCIEPASGMDIKKIKTRYGKELCLMGNMDPALLSVQGSQSDAATQYARLRRAVFNLMAFAGGNDGFIFGSCSGLHAGMSPELVQYMYHLVSEADAALPGCAGPVGGALQQKWVG